MADWLVRFQCGEVIGLAKYDIDVYESRCTRLRYHLGCCRHMTTLTYTASYFDINRETWPSMSRRTALLDAWKLARKVTA